MKSIVFVLATLLTTGCGTRENNTAPVTEEEDPAIVALVKAYSTSPKFSVNDESDLKWKMYAHDSARHKITTLSLSGFDTIPSKFAIFPNVEKVELELHGGPGISINGLDMFPKLSEVSFWGAVVHIDTLEKWPQRVSVLQAEKSTIRQLKSFRSLPNLEVLKLAFSDFDEFPSDIESLDSLKEIEIGAYVRGRIDLSKIDLRKFRSLKKATFITWDDCMTGLPKGIAATSKLIDLKVSHPNLTIEEKATLRRYRSGR